MKFSTLHVLIKAERLYKSFCSLSLSLLKSCDGLRSSWSSLSTLGIVRNVLWFFLLKKREAETVCLDLKFQILYTICWAFLCSKPQPSSLCSLISVFKIQWKLPHVLLFSLPPKLEDQASMSGLQLKTAMYLIFLSAAQLSTGAHDGFAVSSSHIWTYLLPGMTSLVAKSGRSLR